jgi:ADP-ribose pyrophosphatase YjhB (NUDIX family)
MEQEILNLFTKSKKLRFNDIEKSLSVRSNALAYHLKQLISKNIIERNSAGYSLTSSSEQIIPYVSGKTSVLPVILIHIGNEKEAFLTIRKKRPYLGYYSLPGGRLLVGESFKEAVKRIMKEKHGLEVKMQKINSISLEHIKKKSAIVYSFLLILTSAKAKTPIKLTSIEKNKSKIISSDYFLIKNHTNSKAKIKIISSKEN